MTLPLTILEATRGEGGELDADFATTAELVSSSADIALLSMEGPLLDGLGLLLELAWYRHSMLDWSTVGARVMVMRGFPPPPPPPSRPEEEPPRPWLG